ncbi:MAG: hypothetical protein C4288_21905 [Leptolyngbya sp. ERB_1_1]
MSPQNPNNSKTPAWALAKIRAAGEFNFKELEVDSRDKKTEKLKEIPSQIFNLSALESLKLGNNEISEIPEEISKLKNLSRLDLRNNRISKIPETIVQLKNLRAHL